MKAGIIYKITHPRLNKDCFYIGYTVETLSKRFITHKRDAKKTKDNDGGKFGKLHRIMWAFGLKDFVIEEIDSAGTLEEVLALERKYIKEYECVKKGLNKVEGSRYLTPRKEAVTITIEGKEIKATSKNALCRKLKIQYTTVNSWQSKGATLQDAIDQSIKARDKTLSKVASIKAFRRAYDSYNELARDKKANKQGYTGQELSKKHKNGSQKELEEILRTPKRFSTKKIEFNLPDGEIKKYNSIKLALEDWQTLAKDFGLNISKRKPAYQTVVSYLNDGQEIEQAFGLIDRPWKKELQNIYKLINGKGYRLIGKLNGQGAPVVDGENKEIFASVKLFAKEYNYEYTTIAEEIKKGLTVEQIRKKRKD